MEYDLTDVLLRYSRENLNNLLLLAQQEIPIVMCGECKWRDTPECCPMKRTVIDDGKLRRFDFCSYGEKEETE